MPWRGQRWPERGRGGGALGGGAALGGMEGDSNAAPGPTPPEDLLLAPGEQGVVAVVGVDLDLAGAGRERLMAAEQSRTCVW